MTDEHELREQDALEIARESRAENDARYAAEPFRTTPFGLSARAKFIGMYDDGCYEIWTDYGHTYHVKTERGFNRAAEREAARQQQYRDDVDALKRERWDTATNRYLDESHERERNKDGQP